MEIPQALADQLLVLEKHATQKVYNYPSAGQKLRVDLFSSDRRESFFLDIWRGGIALRGNFQNRVYVTCILARVDFGGPPHSNPDGQIIGGTHLHYYREGYGWKWAVDLPCPGFTNCTDPTWIYGDFLRHCNIITPPRLIGNLI